jgi:hypothetical protein
MGNADYRNRATPLWRKAAASDRAASNSLRPREPAKSHFGNAIMLRKINVVDLHIAAHGESFPCTPDA